MGIGKMPKSSSYRRIFGQAIHFARFLGDHPPSVSRCSHAVAQSLFWPVGIKLTITAVIISYADITNCAILISTVHQV